METKRDENGIGPGMKFDQDKLRWDLLPMDAVQEAVKIMTFGARKYSANNWQKLEDFDNRYYGALMRHLTAWRLGESRDPESGELHLSHALTDLIFLLWNELRKDIPK